MAGTARDAHAIRADQLVVVGVRGIVHETIAIPFLTRYVIEFWIRKNPKPEHAGRFAVDVLVDAFRFRFYLLIEPQTEFTGCAWRAKPRFVVQAEDFETIAAGIFAVIEHLQEIDETIAVLCGAIPETLVARAPKVPCVAAHNFLGGKIKTPVHWFENVSRDLRKIGRGFSCRFRFVDQLVLLAGHQRDGE